MAVEIYRAELMLMEHTYFASREVGIFYESEPLIGNYALAYALGLCAAPYDWSGPPRYKEDLGPLNNRGLYVTPATFVPHLLRYALSQFNAQTDSYYFRFDQNAIATDREKKARGHNFPQSGKIRMLDWTARHLFPLDQHGIELNLPSYIRLGKFNSKAHLEWEQLALKRGNRSSGKNRRWTSCSTVLIFHQTRCPGCARSQSTMCILLLCLVAATWEALSGTAQTALVRICTCLWGCASVWMLLHERDRQPE